MNEEEATGTEKRLGNVISINEGQVKAHLDGMLLSAVEETLNALLDA